MTARQSTARAYEVSENTRFGIKLPLSGWWAVLVAVGGIFTGVAAYHHSAMAHIDNTAESVAHTIRIERDEKLKQYPTWNEIRKLREDDYKFWNGQIHELRRDIIEEIRRTR